jgi:hypothetical protein
MLLQAHLEKSPDHIHHFIVKPKLHHVKETLVLFAKYN